VNDSDSMRPSLLDLFSPPQVNKRGIFGLMCSLSADEYFMDAAMERFSGLSSSQRRHYGRLFAILCLDARNKPMQSLPGLYGSWACVNIWKKMGLMHAKVALLGFGESASGKPDYYRLIVSTGNWTKEAVNNSINLTWFCDYDTRCRENQKQNGKDIIKAVAFWQRLLGTSKEGAPFYRISDVVGSKHVQPFLHDVADKITLPSRGYPARFVSNLLPDKKDKRINNFAFDSVGAQVVSRFRSDKKRRNLVVCGSGFFEQASKRKAKSSVTAKEPVVLRNLIEQLKNRVLTRDPYKWLVINPQTSGAVGHWIKNIDPDALEWELRCPKHPDVKPARQPYPFHAKYVFIGNWNSSITNGLIYIGSGNLSRQGFTLGLEHGGNIEAGVVVETGKINRINEFCRLLGVDPDKFLQPNDIRLDELQGEEVEQNTLTFYEPAPITCFICERATNELTFQCGEFSWGEMLLTWPNGHKEAISRNQTKLAISEADVDFSSGVILSAQRNGQYSEWVIPVFTPEGMFCLPPRLPKTGHEIIDSLMAFPQYEEEDEVEDDEPEFPEENYLRHRSLKDDSSELRKALNTFPLHLATTLVETIAEQNQQVTIGQMPDWIEHLRRTLIEEVKPETKHDLIALDRRLLSPLLKTQGFAPQCSTHAYRKAIREINDNWIRSDRVSCEKRVQR
jgi:hypothetical protein